MATVEFKHAAGSFEGFDEKDKDLDEGRHQRRARLADCVINELVVKLGLIEARTNILETENLKIMKTQEELKKMCNLKSEELDMLNKKTDDLEKENLLLKKENEKLASQVQANKRSVENYDENIREIKIVQNEWAREKDVVKVNFREIIESQKQDKENLTNAVIKVIKEKDNIIRDTVDKKKCVIIFGVKEKILPVRPIREKDEMEVVKDILQVVQEENPDQDEEIEEVSRLGRYEEGGTRPMKVKFRSQIKASEILSRSWKLAQREEYKKIWIRKDLNEEERANMNELLQEAKQKNEMRTEEEKKRFYWKVREQRMIKWYLQGEE